MKVTHLSMIILGGVVAGVVHAQPSSAPPSTGMTLYGLVDTAIRYSNANPTNDKGNGALWQLADGGLGGSRWGLRGKENLGGGMGAFFVLESGFSSSNGQPDNAGHIFGRQALVGLEMSGGTLSVGRQYGLVFESISAFNPIGLGKLPATAWHAGLAGMRFDNSVRYQTNVAGVKLGLMYALGEKTGDERKGRTVSASLGYEIDSLTLSTAWQESRDDRRRASRAWSVGGTWSPGPVRLFAGFMDNRLDKDFGADMSTDSKPLVNPLAVWGTSGMWADREGKGRRDQLIIAGLSHKPTSALNLTAGYMNDRISGVEVPHRRHTLYGVADYALSSRTGMYLAVDHNRNTKGAPLYPAEQNAPAYKDRQTGLMVGLRHKF